MGYHSITNLYKCPEVLNEFIECYAMEKVHGTSARVVIEENKIQFVSGGAKYDEFAKFFNKEELMKCGIEIFDSMKKRGIIKKRITIYGEAYGGKMQKMSATYGPRLKFIAFEVTFDDRWLLTPFAEEVVHHFNLDFVPYKIIPATIPELNAARDEDSQVAIQNGMGPGKLREGIVIKPVLLHANTKASGDIDEKSITKSGKKDRLLNMVQSEEELYEPICSDPTKRKIYKHKRAEFSELATPRELTTGGIKSARESKQSAEAISKDWVTVMRFHHVMDQLKRNDDETKIVEKKISFGDILQAMVNDIKKESIGEIEFNSEIEKEIKRRCSVLIKANLKI